MKFNVEELQKRIEQKLINVQKHPDADLYIYNYTPACQFSKAWDEFTMAARGLILDGEGNVVARPFPKFFNYQEFTGTIPADEPFKVYEKLDGSLGVMYPHDGRWYLATRGSFTSEQAKVGSTFLRRYIKANGTDWIEDGYTYLFEIIYPYNRIVVNYGQAERLPLLAKIRTEDAVEADIAAVQYDDKAAEWYDAKAIEDLKAVQTPNAEGFVIVFQNGFRLKMKFDEYVRLHAIVTGTNSRVVWELMAVEKMHTMFPALTDKDIGDRILYIDKRIIQTIMDKGDTAVMELIQNAPDEMQDWITDVCTELQDKHDALLRTAYSILDKTTDPKEIAKMDLSEYEDGPAARSVAFFLMGGRMEAAEGLAWKAAYPEHTLPYREDIDA